MQKRSWLAFVGGFLGAGKTTLILRAARLLTERGQRVAVIMNDQDAELVDTKHAHAYSLAAREIVGGCFCCRFSELIGASETLLEYQPDVIFAEPVGSCTDLSATLLQPLKHACRHMFQLAPLTVLLDPARLGGSLDAESEFLFRNQLAEADLICTTKSDLYGQPHSLGFPIDFALSAKTGVGVAPWLHEILSNKRIPGARLLEIDYDRYAEAEAALGWLNLQCEIQFGQPLSPALVCGPLLDYIEEQLRAESIAIAHLKMFDECGGGWLKLSVTGTSALPQPDGDLLAEPSLLHRIAINLRALGDPHALERIVQKALSRIDGKVTLHHLRAFRPSPPKPEHRFNSVL